MKNAKLSLLLILFLATFSFGEGIWFFGDTGVTTYKVVLMQPSSGQVYDAVASTFGDSNSVDYADRAINVNEDPNNLGFYQADTMPVIEKGFYIFRVYDTADGTLDDADTVKGNLDLNWDGSAEITLADIINDSGAVKGAGGNRLSMIIRENYYAGLAILGIPLLLVRKRK